MPMYPSGWTALLGACIPEGIGATRGILPPAGRFTLRSNQEQDPAPSTTDCRPQPTPWPQPFCPLLDRKTYDKSSVVVELELCPVVVAHPSPVPFPAGPFNQ